MGKGRKYNTKPRSRPRKTGAARRRRQKEQRERLIALGVAKSVVERMDPTNVRRLLKRPARVKRA